ncbi:hypothetical protein TVAG_110050 [Trichomonas vaginalis G3]|uniref:Uncharacterized protein n=1 Tax=Trichomonas vaginalis (strain ATCC PRA-98 / G3) TaxID=412133 RepID=A2DGK6_TRIV3|nr:transcriptional adapter 1 family [Trichomonas vaginalis G3]EAY20393.1 hypothetical protein TVAG_110050 [Trichomonas vaginalis G3]KAI5490561.1 transcriptional adapter 1 family [Trichomonas vaginalis G3]|eukprot:XP_001581379.1 hypothetical protein [Trichomonas vaginalis G3]
MSGELEDAGIQVGECPEQLAERVKNSASIYSLRKDSQAIKAQLLQLIAKELQSDYWSTLASFIHGQCSKTRFDEIMEKCLQSNEAKIMHNELIRSIIYNAHFSMIPPPNVDIPHAKATVRASKPPISVQQVKNHTFMTYTAADLHHLPSINQLTKRVCVIISDPKFQIDSKAVNEILTELKKFVCQILYKSLELAASEGPTNGHNHITVDHVQQVLKMNSQISTVISPSVISKFDMTTK